MTRGVRSFAAIVSLFLISAAPSNAEEPKRITILHDAFGAPSALVKDWGFAAFVEYGGRRILFDTGNNARTFAPQEGAFFRSPVPPGVFEPQLGIIEAIQGPLRSCWAGCGDPAAVARRFRE